MRVDKKTAAVAGSAAVVGAIYGYDNGSIATAALFLRPDFGLSSAGLSTVVASISVGMLVGAFFGGRITNAAGRKRTILGVAAGYMVFSGLQAAAFDMWSLVVIRGILGFVIGVSIVAAPAFIAESAPARSRGALLVAFQIAETTGLAVSYLVGVGLASTESWRLILGLAAVPTVLVFVLVRRLPDTPRWYLMKGRRQEALAVLRRDVSAEQAEREADLIEYDLGFEQQGSLRELFTGPLRKAAVFAILLGFSVQITGIQAVVQYSPTILQDVGFGSDQAAIIGAALVQVLGVGAEVISFLVVDRWGRRPTLLTGIGIMAAANGILISAFAAENSPILTLIGILVFTLGFNFGYGALVWVYASECMPARLRTQGASVLLTADLFGNVLVSMLFLSMVDAIGGALTFGTFLVLTFAAFAFIYRYAPETKRRRLEDIRHYWTNGARWPTEVPSELIEADTAMTNPESR